jgi:hypothetical protein
MGWLKTERARILQKRLDVAEVVKEARGQF